MPVFDRVLSHSASVICNLFVLFPSDSRTLQAKTRTELCWMNNLFLNCPIMNQASAQAALFRKLQLGIWGPLEKELPPLCLIEKTYSLHLQRIRAKTPLGHFTTTDWGGSPRFSARPTRDPSLAPQSQVRVTVFFLSFILFFPSLWFECKLALFKLSYPSGRWVVRLTAFACRVCQLTP